MPSDVLNYARQKYPSVADASDKDLTVYIGNKYPSLLKQDEQFASEFKSYTAPEHSFSEDFGKSFVASIIHDTPAAIYSTLQAYLTGMGEADLSAFEVVSPVGMALRTFAPETSKSVRDTLGQTMKELADESKKMGQALRETGEIARGVTDAKFDRGVDQDSWGSTFGAGAGSLVPIFATGGALGVAGVTGRAAYGTVMAVGGLQEFGSTFQTAQEKYYQSGIESGLTEEQAAKQAEQKAMLPAAARGGTVVALMATGGAIAKKLGATNIEKFAAGMRNPSTTKALDTVAKGAGLRSTKIKWSEKLGKFTPIPTGAVIEGGEEAGTSWIGEYLIARHSYDPTVTFEQANAEAWKSFVVGGTLGGVVGGVQKIAESVPDPDTAAKRDTIRRVAPSTASRLDEMDAASRVLPDEETDDTLPPVIIPLPEGADPDVIDIRRGKRKATPARDEVVSKFTKDGKVKMPAWWNSYENSLRYADQKTVDRFIEDQEANNELSQMSVEKNQEGDWEVRQGAKEIGIFETEAEANQVARATALRSVKPKVLNRINRYKKLTKSLSDLEKIENETATQPQTEQQDETVAEISEEDKKFVAETLGISEENLPFSGLDITPEMVDKLRFAPQEGVAEFLREAEERRNAAQEAEFFKQRQQEEDAARTLEDVSKAKEKAINDFKEALEQRPRQQEDIAEQQQRAAEATTPDTIQLSEFAEEQLSGAELNPTQKKVLNGLQQTKANLIAESVDAPEVRQEEIRRNISDIDGRVAGIINEGKETENQIRPPEEITTEQLQQLQEEYDLIDTTQQGPTEPQDNVVDIGGNSIEFTDDTIDPTQVAGAADPNAQPSKADLNKEEIQQKVSEALEKLSKRFKDLIGLKEVRIVKLKAGAGVASLSARGVSDTILIDVDKIARSLTVKKFSLEKALEEELIHNLDAKALTAEYARRIDSGELSPSVTLREFINNRYTEVANGMTAQERAAAKQLYGNDFISDVHMAQEFIRQLIQQKHTKSITEEAYRSGPIRRLLELFKQFFSRQNLSPALKAHVDQVEGFLERTYKVENADARTAEEKAALAAQKENRKQEAIRIREARKKILQAKEKIKDDEEYVKKLAEILGERESAEIVEVIKKRIPMAIASLKAKYGKENFTTEIEDFIADNILDTWLKRSKEAPTQPAAEPDFFTKTLEEGSSTMPHGGYFAGLAKNFFGKYYERGRAAKRGGGVENILSLQKLIDEGFDPSIELTTGGQGLLNLIAANKENIGLNDNELKYAHYLVGGELTQKQMAEEMGVSESTVSNAKTEGLQKILNHSNNNPQFLNSLLESVQNPNQFIDATAAIGAADPVIGKNRIAELVEAQKKYQDSKKTRADWDELNQAIENYKTILDAVELPTKDSLLTEETIISYLEIESLSKQKSAIQKGKDYFAAKKRGNPIVKKGDEVDVRIDIPIYQETGNYVVTIHGKGKGIIGYDSFIHLTEGISFIEGPDKIKTKIAKGEARKSSFARVRGKVASVDVLPDVSGKEWTQIGFDPERHSYFYNRANPSQRVLSGSEAVSIGNTVFVKDAVMEDAYDSGVAYAAEPFLAEKPEWNILTKLGNFKKKVFRIFDSSGGLRMPSLANADKQLDFFQKKIEKDAYINSVMGEVRATNRRLKKAVKEFFGKNPSPEQVALMNNALAGDAKAIKALPEDIADIIGGMRRQIDALSKHIVKKGWVSGELKAKVEENIDTYIARSYRVFDDPKYVENIDPEVINKAVNFVEKQLIKNGVPASKAQLMAMTEIKDMLAEYSSKGRGSFDSGRLGEKDLSLFMKRKDIAPEIRALMGEYKDPLMNYTRSITRLAQFIGNHKFLTDLKRIGLNEIFFEEKDTRRTLMGANERVKGFIGKTKEGEEDASRGSYSPLAGLYTTEEVNLILEEFNAATAAPSGVYGFLIRMNILSKTTKTLMSVMTNVRNAMGQIPFAILNGHNPFAFRKAAKAISAIWSDAAGNNRSAQLYFNKMTRLGLVGEEMTTAELQRVIGNTTQALDESVSAEDFLNKSTGLLLKSIKAGKRSFNALARAYRASDEVGKIMNFEMERELLKPLYPELTDAQLDTLAAQRTRGGVPTYSEMPPAIQNLRMQPFVGPFMSFFYEAMRTQVMNVKYAGIEFKNGGKSLNPMNPHTRYAARRIGGHLAITAGLSLTLKMISEMYGEVSEEEQENVRSLLPDYEKDAQFYFYRDKEGEVKYVNISFNNPYAATTDPVMSMLGLNGMKQTGNIAENVLGKFAGMMEPFTSETIVAQAAIDVARNQTQYGTTVFNEEAGTGEQVKDGVVHLARTLTPGTLDRIYKRWIPAKGKETLPSGEKPNLADEVAAELSGFRVRTIEYKDKLTKTSFGTAKRFSNANKIFNGVAAQRGTVTNDEMLDAYREANESRLRIFKDIDRQIKAAEAGGLSRKEIMLALKAGGISQSDIVSILRGYYRPLDISESVARRARDADHPIPKRDIMSIKREYLRQPLYDENAE